MPFDDQQPPWGRKNTPSSPEDFLAALLRKLANAFKPDNQDPSRNSRQPQQPNLFALLGKILLMILALILIQVVFTSYYTIKPHEVGIILRLGKNHRQSSPGLHFKIPYFEELYKVDVTGVRKEEFGFRTIEPGVTTLFEKKNYENESLMLTGDKNVINVAWVVQYKVSNPVNFLFKVKNVSQAVRDASEMVTRRIVGNMDFDYVLGNREILAEDARRELQTTLDKLQCGVSITTLQLQNINPPDPVKPAFNEVNEADQDMQRLVNEAEETYNRVIPKARGNAKQIVEEAHGYAIQRVNQAKGETERFNALVTEYLQAQDVTRTRMYLEAMHDILPRVKQVYIINNDQQTLLPFLDLSRETGGKTETEK